MKNVFAILLVAVIGIAFYIYIDKKQPQIEKQQEQNIELFEKSNAEERGVDPILETISGMTLDEKIGQLFIAGVEGATVTDETVQKLKKYSLGGVILFKPNLENPEQSLKMINDLKKIDVTGDFPLFISVDQEGGRVTRLPGLQPLKSAAEIGELSDEKKAYENGQLIGRQLQAFGFQVNFAPVLDINSNPNNTVIGDRAFGDNTEIVSKMGIAMMKGLQDENVITAVKHFPGHGDTLEDSHEVLPAVHKTRAELAENELVPFKNAINAGVDMVLTAHIVLPELNAEYPATMSKEVVDILREDWNYDGVIITDDLTMGAIADNYGTDEAVVKAVQAGVDILLIAHGDDKLLVGFSSLKAAVEDGEISEKRIDKSVYRVLQLKEKYKLQNDIIEDISIEKLNEDIDEVYGK